MLKGLKNKLFSNKKQLSRMAVFCILALSPLFSLAQIEITEIMYDLEIGGDTGREWLEIYNSGNEDVDLSNWKLYEAESNHKISSIIEEGNTILVGGGYAILVDNYEKFKEDWPNFSGLVLDTAFSLKNTGELLVIRNPDLVDIDSVNYLSDWGANGDGKSLQKINNDWVAVSPTLGLVNSVVGEEDLSVEEEIPVVTTPTTTSSNSSPDFVEVNIKAKIDSLEYFPVAGADFTFNGKALGLEDEVLENAQYQWSFGDGTSGKGQNVLHNFNYPGEYLVVLEVISGEYSRCDRLKVKVVPSEIIISKINMDLNDNYVELYNPSNNEINLSWWRLRSDNLYFTLPKNTVLLPKSYLKLAYAVTKLFPRENSIIQLLYPNGMLAFNFVEEKKLNLEMKTTSFIKKETEIVEKIPLIYSVEKPVEIRGNEETINNQMATIKNSLDNKIRLKEVEPPRVEKGNNEGNGGFQFPLNKWNLMLGGIILIAVVGVGYATKLDVDNEKPF